MIVFGLIRIDTGTPWEAIASLSTGVLTVGAAAYVALRQLGISRRQTEIQESLAAIEAAKLRAELFDRRFQIYEATARFGGSIMATARFPSDEVARDFQLASDRAKLLFRPSVHAKLNEAWGRACDLMAATDTLDGETDHAERQRLAQAKAEHLRYFASFLTNLSDVFGDELRLGEFKSG